MEHRLRVHDVASPRGVVLMLHGGAEDNPDPVDARNRQLWRMRLMYGAIRARLSSEGVATALLRFSVVGWNAGHGPQPAPVGDARWALDRLRSRYAGLPVVLLGHSMGARTAAWVADDPVVRGVVGLAPWFPPDDPVHTLVDRHVVGAHGSADRITLAKATRRFLERAEPVAASTRFIDRGPIGHYLLRDIRGWNSVAVTEPLRILTTDLPAG